MRCPRCGSLVDGDDCPYCGYGLISRSDGSDEGVSDLGKTIRSTLMWFMLATFIIYLIFTVALLLSSAPYGFSHTETESEVFFIVVLFPIGLIELSGLPLTIYFALLVLAILISVGFLFYRSFDLFVDVVENLKSKKRDEGGLHEDVMDHPLTRLALLFSVMVFVSYLYFMALELGGVTPEAPALEEYSFGRIVFLLTQASVWEEIVVRFAYFGIPMMIYAYFEKSKGAWKYLFGGFGLEERPVVPLILFTSFIFSSAHLVGWDVFKFPQVFVGGIIFGYLFAKDGLYSCIIFHFAWDYTSVFTRVSQEATVTLSILILIWMGIGVYFTYYYLTEMVGWFRKQKKKADKKEDIQEEKELKFGHEIGFLCSNCKSYKAEYVEGRLKCKTCGKETDLSSNESFRRIKPIEAKRQWPPME